MIRKTERAIIPERGAMLGNFGAAPINAEESWVTDAEYINKAIAAAGAVATDDNRPAREAGAGSGVEETGWRSESQQIEVAAKHGKTLLLAGPLHRSFLLRRKPQVFKTATARQGEPGIRYAGIEDLSFSGGGTPGDGQPSIWLLNTAYCWVKNVEGDGRPDTVLPGTYANPGGMTGIHVQLSHAYRCEVRHSYLHHARVVRNGGIAYGISVAGGSSDNLIEDNILINLNKPYLGNNSGGGNVIAYNRKLPNSLFHRSKPPFFGSLDWPWVNPTASTPAARVKVLPAKQRYDRGTPFASG